MCGWNEIHTETGVEKHLYNPSFILRHCHQIETGFTIHLLINARMGADVVDIFSTSGKYLWLEEEFLKIFKHDVEGELKLCVDAVPQQWEPQVVDKHKGADVRTRRESHETGGIMGEHVGEAEREADKNSRKGGKNGRKGDKNETNDGHLDEDDTAGRMQEGGREECEKRARRTECELGGRKSNGRDVLCMWAIRAPRMVIIQQVDMNRQVPRVRKLQDAGLGCSRTHAGGGRTGMAGRRIQIGWFDLSVSWTRKPMDVVRATLRTGRRPLFESRMGASMSTYWRQAETALLAVPAGRKGGSLQEATG
ncbi:hypothetical protein FIBSPDRAFT_894354 [Athelia psychrophila]|uniref:Uncharacterized protein n=1 Tax=Athelia psychrophila TaxID=1759441 RepID=A0A166G3T7_9AGAM|nr:hypothetical protein FIBSPDRAFT_894354 [Fibularhizoctonia sp. CBS 109695]